MTRDSLLGKVLDGYRLEALLGHGATARVYRGLDLSLQRLVAVKVIDKPYRGTTEYATRFRREAQTIAQLEHPNIVRLYRYGEVDDVWYMAMQYVPGADLGHVLASYRAEGGRMAPAEIARLVRDLGQALHHAHRQGVIHRDVKPGNILIDPEGRALLTDFGLALLTEAGTRGQSFGSPHYRAPEQAHASARAVPQSDLYSLGVILYEIFTGRVPFTAPNPLEVALLHIEQAPRPPREWAPDLSPAVEAVILKTLAKQPEDRYPDGPALAEALEQALATGARAGGAVSVVPAPDTLAQLSLAQRAALRAAEALQPVSAAAPGVVVVPEPLRPRPRPRAFGWLGASLIVGLILISLLTCALLALLALGRRPALPAVFATQPEPTHAVFLPFLSQTGSEAPTGEPAPGSHVLIIARANGGERLFAKNAGTLPLDLTALALGDGPGSIDGGEWARGALAPGECVAAGQPADPASQAPAELACTWVGETLVRLGDRRFWRAGFAVYYAGNEVGRCAEDAAQCQVSWPGASP